MINTITVSEQRGVFPEKSNIGTTGERNATTLVFLLPESLQGYEMSLVFTNAYGSFPYTVDNNSFDLPQEILTDSVLNMQIILKDNDRVIWKSKPTTFNLNPALDDSGVNVIDTAKAEQRETDRTELAGVVSELTGEDFKNSGWDELIDVTNELPIKTEQDIVDLTGYSELTNAFRQATTAPSLITGGYNLDKDENEDDILIKLPYLYTPNAKYSDGTLISNSVVECGFDVSASGDTLCHYNEVSMFNQRYCSKNLRKLKLTGFECVAYGNAMFSNIYGPLLNLVELTLEEGNNYRDEYSAGYYKDFFFKLQEA